jgi:diamine N-acetyltransferase
VYADDVPVGFVMVYDATGVEAPGETDFFLWRLMIDRHAQGRGYGSAAVELVLAYARTRGAPRILVSHVKTAPALGRFYESFGFTYIEREDDRERYMARGF